MGPEPHRTSCVLGSGCTLWGLSRETVPTIPRRVGHSPSTVAAADKPNHRHLVAEPPSLQKESSRTRNKISIA